MIISQARIILSNQALPAVLVLENGDKLVDCVIEEGEITARGEVYFQQCVIATDKDKTPTVLGESPPHPMPMVANCKILKTKLPDAYYSMCVFDYVEK